MNALTTAEGAGMPVNLNSLKQMSGLLTQPAVRRAMPLLFLVSLVVAGLLAWSMLSTPPQRVLFANVTDADKQAISTALQSSGIKSSIDNGGSITVAEDDFHKARMLLASQDLPKAAPGGYALLDSLPMGASRAVEGERLRQARETELARSIREIDAVAEARVHLATPEASAFIRNQAEPSASVILKLQPGRSLNEAQIRAIVNLVAASVPGMNPQSVTVVDQMGALLSKKNGTDGQNDSANEARIDFQKRVEGKYREQVVQLLTPMVGAGNFSAEVQAEIDVNESLATRETYDKDGQVIRAEQGNWTGTSPDSATPGGIPGALSNIPPAASTLTAPNAAAANGTTEAAATRPPVQQKQSDSFARTYETGKEISVTRAAPGSVKRLSVAVLLREETGKPRSAAELQQITELVQAAVGFSADRQDQVRVISRKFGNEASTALATNAWYDEPWVPMVARNATAVIVALLVLLLGVRPLAKALLKRREDPVSVPGLALGQSPDGQMPDQPVSVDMLADAGNGYDERVGLVRGFTRDNPARAALAVRDMIRADGQ